VSGLGVRLLIGWTRTALPREAVMLLTHTFNRSVLMSSTMAPP